VGCIAALAAARIGPVIHVVPHEANVAPQVDSVPAPLLALLLEFGVHPAEIGVDDLQDTRMVSWESRDPAILRTRGTAHVKRPALDLALRAAAARSPAVTTVRTPGGNTLMSAEHGIDASGRSAVSAVRRVRPTDPWVARTFSVAGRFSRAARAFQLAAFPTGYVYRLGIPDLLTFGIVAPKRHHHTAIEDELRRLNAGWILAGLPSLDTMAVGRGGITSVQWTEGLNRLIRVGDAALARDSLSSQGIANGISDALRAAQGEAASRRRQMEERQAHLTSLIGMIERCWCASSSVWVEYRGFLARHLKALDVASDRTVPDVAMEKVATGSCES
jgi:hypothetical protein